MNQVGNNPENTSWCVPPAQRSILHPRCPSEQCPGAHHPSSPTAAAGVAYRGGELGVHQHVSLVEK